MRPTSPPCRSCPCSSSATSRHRGVPRDVCGLGAPFCWDRNCLSEAAAKKSATAPSPSDRRDRYTKHKNPLAGWRRLSAFGAPLPHSWAERTISAVCFDDGAHLDLSDRRFALTRGYSDEVTLSAFGVGNRVQPRSSASDPGGSGLHAESPRRSVCSRRRTCSVPHQRHGLSRTRRRERGRFLSHSRSELRSDCKPHMTRGAGMASRRWRHRRVTVVACRSPLIPLVRR